MTTRASKSPAVKPEMTGKNIVQCYVPDNQQHPFKWSYRLSNSKAKKVQDFIVSLMQVGNETD